MNEQNILVPKESIFKIKDREYKIGKITLKQAIVFGQFITENILTKRDKLKQLQGTAGKSTSNAQDLINIVNILEPTDVYRFFGILLKENDTSFLETNLDLEDSFEVIALICEHNDFEKIKKKFLRITQVLNKEKTQ